MLDGLIGDQPRGIRLALLVAGGLLLELGIMLVGAEGPSELIGIHSVLGIAVAIGIGIVGGPVAGAVTAGFGAVVFVIEIAYGASPDPALYGLPVIALWVVIAASAGAATRILRRSAHRAEASAAAASDRMLGLHHAVEHLAATSKASDVARIAAEEGARALHADGAWVAVTDEAQGLLHNVAATGFGATTLARYAAVSLDAPTVAAETARDGRARFFADAASFAMAYPAMADGYRATGFEGCAVLPLLRRGSPIGIIAFHFARPRVLSDEERDLARAFADTAAQAFERARLHEEVVRTAETLQRSLLPFRLPTFPGYDIAARYLPAFDTVAVGGDWYDVVEAGHGQIGIGVGDVGGKGVEAAASMGRLRTALRAYAIEHAAPRDVLQRLVEYHALTRPDIFATVVYAALDRHQRRLRIASLGHPAPLLLREGRAVPLALHADPPLGIETPRSYRELAVPIQAGDLLVFMSDGVIERRDRPIDDGLRLLAAAAAGMGDLPVGAVADQLISCVNDEDAGDDRALVVVRVPGGPAAAAAEAAAEEPAPVLATTEG